MLSLIGFLVDLISFIFAILILPVCTITFWLTYNDPKLELEKESQLTEKNKLEGETL